MYPTSTPGVQFAFISNFFTTGGTAFDDFFTFDLSGTGSQAGGSASALSTKFTGFTISQTPLALTMKLVAWDGTGYNTVLANSGLPSLTPSVEAALGANIGGATGHGYYALEVLGTTPVGAVITQYSGQLQLAAAAPVPEPSTYGLLGAGLVFVAWQVRRNSKEM